MTHAHHDGLDNFVEEAIFHTGCVECSDRASMKIGALRLLDRPTMERACVRAFMVERHGCAVPPEEPTELRILCDPLELPFLRELSAVLISLRTAGLWGPQSADPAPEHDALIAALRRAHAQLDAKGAHTSDTWDDRQRFAP